MKPEIACANHPKTEGLFRCRFCGKDYCERCVPKEDGLYRCDQVSCRKAFKANPNGPSPIPSAAGGKTRSQARVGFSSEPPISPIIPIQIFLNPN